MNTCWKCGRTVNDRQVECEDGCPPRARATPVKRVETTMAQLQAQLARRLRLDWSKVKTTEDMMLVISTLFSDASIDPDCDAAKKLAAFLIKPTGAEPTDPT